jgi:general secretion pathway protein C
MVDAIMQAWQLRVLRNGPRLISVLLAALIVAECLRTMLPLMIERTSKALPSASLGRNIQHPHSSGLDVRNIVAAHLFGIAAEDLQDPAHASATTANLVLQGTVATRNPKQGVAIIAASGPPKVYRVGDDVEGASLYSVSLEHVLLDRGGRFETLALPRFASTTVHGAPQPQAGSVDNKAVETTPRAPQDSKSIAHVIRAQAAVDGEDLHGFIIHPSSNVQAFLKTGLRQNDMVTAVNGTSVTNQDVQHGQEVMDAMLATGQATVTVVRNGQTVDVPIDLSP